MPTQAKTQVVIIGAGPTGLSMAVQLLRYNTEFIILEKNEKTTLLSKAIAVQARTLEIFDQIGLAQKAIQKGRLTNAINIFYKGKRKVALNVSGLGEGITPFPFALSLEQSKTEKLLADYLAEHGKTIRWKSEFVRLEQNSDDVTVYYKDAEGKEQSIEASYVVGCDGASSPVRHGMGASFEGDTVPKIFYVADVKISSSIINKDELYGFLIKKGFILFFPMEGTNHYRIVGVLTDKKEEDPTVTFKDIEGHVKKSVEVPVEFEEVLWFSSYRVHSRMANAFMKGRCFIAGDAAHIHTPAGGQGMNTGIQDAYNLAWKMAFVLNGKVNASVLESYNTERISNAKHLLNSTDKMFDILAGTSMIGNFIRLKIIPLVGPFIAKNRFLNKRLFPLVSQTGIAYPNSMLTIKSTIGKMKAGDRMPYVVFPDGLDIYELLKEPGFKILFFGQEGGNQVVESEDFKLIDECLSFVASELDDSSRDFYILLRPDNHISYVGKGLDQCRKLLKKISRQQSRA